MLVVYHTLSDKFLHLQYDTAKWIDEIDRARRFENLEDVYFSCSVLIGRCLTVDGLLTQIDLEECVIVPVILVNNSIHGINYSMSIPYGNSTF